MPAMRRCFEGRHSRCDDAPQEGLSSRNELDTPNHDHFRDTGGDVNSLDFSPTPIVRLKSHVRPSYAAVKEKTHEHKLLTLLCLMCLFVA